MSSIRRPTLIFNDTFLSGGVETPGIPTSEVLTLLGSAITKNAGDADFAATYTVVDANGVTRTGMKLRSSDRKVVRVNADGTLRVMGGGSCTLELDSGAGSGTIAVTITGATYTGEDPDTGVYRYGVVLGGGGGGGGGAPANIIVHTNSIYNHLHFALDIPELYGWTAFEGNHPAKNWDDLRGFAAAEVDAHRTSANDILIASEGTNQCTGAVTVADGQAAWDSHGLLYMNDRLAAGWLPSQIMLCGTLYSGASTGYASQTAMDAYNARQKAWCLAVGATYIDVPAEPTMGPYTAPESLTLYQDKIHPTNLGYQLITAPVRTALVARLTSQVPAWLTTLAAAIEALGVGVHLDTVYTADGVFATKSGAEVTALASENRWRRALTKAGTGPSLVPGTGAGQYLDFTGAKYLVLPPRPGDGFTGTDTDLQNLNRHTTSRYGYSVCVAVPALPASNLNVVGAAAGSADLLVANDGTVGFYVPAASQVVGTITGSATPHTISVCRSDAGGDRLVTQLDGAAILDAAKTPATFAEPNNLILGAAHPGFSSADTLAAVTPGLPHRFYAIYFLAFDAGAKLTSSVHAAIRSANQTHFGAA